MQSRAFLQDNFKWPPMLGARTSPPWRQPRGKSMVSSVNSHTNATRIGWHLWEIDLRFATGLPPGWVGSSKNQKDLTAVVRSFVRYSPLCCTHV